MPRIIDSFVIKQSAHVTQQSLVYFPFSFSLIAVNVNGPFTLEDVLYVEKVPKRF